MATGSERVTIETTVQAPVEKVWELWTEPTHITQWNSPSEDWHTPHAENDLRVGGKFTSRMEAKDGSFGFDFGGVYDDVKTHEAIVYTIGDDREVQIQFIGEGGATKVIETFETETMNAVEMQRAGWQAILDNFKKYAESNA
ncbi:SRPBCC family protein [Paenibacillus silvisoli]|uniref:SRPBCC family protein n=1 Tax=Paenibacillus silvisoli TaxID=3110539 RepID=UPI002805EE53|nr:SRPBCC family protein [Paenibacillus silvisoli]